MSSDYEYDYESLRGQAGRDPARRFARYLRRQGFLPTRHFIERFLERVLRTGRRFDPRTFRREFFQSHHYRQTRPGYHTRIAVVRRVPILYRPGGWSGRQIVLVGVLPVDGLPPVVRTRPPEREVDLEKDGQHGSRYQRARQVFLRRLSRDWRQPRFVKGWIAQERRRQRQTGLARPAGWHPSGQARATAKGQFLRAVLTDPTQDDAARKWARRQLMRLARGRKRLKALQAGEELRLPRLRGIPGYDVGHPIGRIPGVHDPRRFRLEMAAANRARPGIARRLGLDPRRYGESEPY